jgi:hypothetical protein
MLQPLRLSQQFWRGGQLPFRDLLLLELHQIQHVANQIDLVHS